VHGRGERYEVNVPNYESISVGCLRRNGQLGNLGAQATRTVEEEGDGEESIIKGRECCLADPVKGVEDSARSVSSLDREPRRISLTGPMPARQLAA
jgi:hypothetical protein